MRSKVARVSLILSLSMVAVLATIAIAYPRTAHGTSLHSTPGHSPRTTADLPAAGWAVVSSPNAGSTTTNNILGGVAALSSNDMWAVGCSSCEWLDTSSSGETLTEHWNGTSWSIVPSANPGTAANVLTAVSANSANDVWAVGYQIVAGVGTFETLIEHWDGASWTPSPGASVPNIAYLNGVDALSSNDVWAVGTAEPTPGVSEAETLIEHWDGTTWSRIASPNLGMFDGLNAVAAVSPSDIWAVGYMGSNSASAGLAEHYDGTSWSAVALPGSDLPTSVLRSVSAISNTNVWAVGTSIGVNASTSQTLVLHWDGTSWNAVPSADPGQQNGLNGIIAISQNDVWAVGTYSTSSDPYSMPLTEFWNGCTWIAVPAQQANTVGDNLNAVAASPSNRALWSVGSYQAGVTGAFAKTLIEKFVGWTPLGKPSLLTCDPNALPSLPKK